MRPVCRAALLAAALSSLAMLSGCAEEAAEGRPWVHDVRVTGNRAIKSGDIKDHIALEDKSWIPLSPKHYLDLATLEVDRKRIEAMYAAHGYFGARVRDVKVTHRDADSVDVTITVDEGPPTHLDRVHVEGLDGLAEKRRAAIVEKIPLRQGDVFNHAKYLQTRGLIEARLKEEGYAWAEVHGEVDIDRGAQRAEALLRVTLGPKATLGTITIQGDTPVERKLIAQQRDFEAGEKFNPEALDNTRAKVFELGVFSSVRVDYVHDPKDPRVANVIVSVRPGPLNELRLGGGIGIEPDRNDVHLRVTYTRANFFGGLRKLRLRLQPGYVVFPNVFDIQRHGPALLAEAQLTQPGFLVRDLTLKATVGFDLGIEYAFRYWGPRGSTGLTYQMFHGRLLLNASYNVQLLNFFDLASGAFDDPLKARKFLGYVNPYRLAYLSEEVILDLRDRPLDPRKGIYLGVNVEEGSGIFGGRFEYQRILPDGRLYFPLGDRIVVAGRVQWGQIFSQGDTASPITRRFYAGGADSHRGFSYYNRLSPQVASNSSLPPIPTGGDKLFLVQAELRINVVYLKGSQLAAVLFTDGGDVPDRDRDVDFGQLHWATGAGLRYQTLIGTLRADLGVRLNRLDAMQADGRLNPDPGSRFAFHISIGEAF